MGDKNVVNSNIANIYSLTPLQEGMLFHNIAKKDTTEYVVQSVYSIKGDFSEEIIENALKLLSKRYDVLRTVIVHEGVSKPKQVVLKERNIEHEIIDLSSYDKEYMLNMVENIKCRDVNRGFNLQKDTLLRVKTIIVNKDEYKMIWCFHHIIMDGWCLSLVYGEFLKYLKMLKDNTTVSKIQEKIKKDRLTCVDYGEYIKWIQKQDTKEGLKYWKDLLKGYQENAQIKTFSQNDKDFESQMERIGVSFSNIEKEKIQNLVTECNVTFNTVVEAAWGILLQRYCNTDDVVFGKIVSGRDIEIDNVQQVVGLFINTLPCRVRCDEDTTVEGLLKNLFEQANKSNEYNFCSLADIQGQTELGPDLIKTIFAFENYYVDEESIKSDEENYSIDVESVREQTNYGISISANLEDGVFTFNIMYDPKEYSKAEIQSILDNYKEIMCNIVEDKYAKVVNISSTKGKEKKTILEQFNTKLEDIDTVDIIKILEETVKRDKDKDAIVFEGNRLTFFDFNKKVNQLAHKLIENGVKKDDFVALITQRSLEMIIAIYAVIKAGGAYVPISPEYSKNRKEYIVQDCKPSLIITYKAGYDIQVDIPVIDLDNNNIWSGEDNNLQIKREKNALVYSIYTSGTTGKPKGVMIEHKGLSNLCKNIEKILYKDDLEITNTALIASYSFDASVKMIFTSLIYGHTLHIISDEMKGNIKELMNYLEKENVTVMDGTPTYLKVINQEYKKRCNIKRLIVGGEELSNSIIEAFIKDKSDSIINVYGPTETTVDATFFKCDIDTKSVFIGKPIENVNIYIIDKHNNLCGVGMPGEICIAGISVARGYINNDSLTKEKFVENPFGYGKMYKSGDIGKWQLDGNIEYIGRKDEQVKIKGFRIELGEIESTITKCKNITDTVVVVEEDNEDNKFICAYVVSDNEINIDDLRNELLKELPIYMIPAYINQIDKVPLTKNGKLDKTKLIRHENVYKKEYIEPKTDKQKIISNILLELLNVEKIGIRERFFELGGDSIKAIRLVSKLRDAGYLIKVQDIMKKQTIEAMAACSEKIVDNIEENQEIYGNVKNTPIINDFIERKLKRPEHYNHSVILKTQTFKYEDVMMALDKLYEHHDILRSVFKNNQLIILKNEECKKYDFEVRDFRKENNTYKLVEDICTKMQQSIDLENGSLMKAAFFMTDKGNYVMICLHHLVVDGVSWRILIEDFETSMKLIQEKKTITLPNKTTSYMSWADLLQDYKNSYIFKEDIKYWKEKIDEIKNLTKEQDNITYGIGYIQKEVIFNVDETEKLVYDVQKKYNVNLNELLLSALVCAMKENFDKQNVIVGVEGHGREELHKKIDIDRSIGWFTCKYPIVLKYDNDLEKVILDTKEMIRSIPHHGIGYGLLKQEYGNVDINIYFNYLGTIDNEIQQDVFSTGEDVSCENSLNSLIIVNALIENKCLKVSFACDKENITESTVNDIVNSYEKCVKNIVKIDNIEEKVITVSDCAQTKVSEQDFSLITDFMLNDMEF